MRSVRAGKINSSFSAQYLAEYISSPQARCPFVHNDNLNNPESLLNAFKFRSAFLIDKVVYALDTEKTSWNDMLIEVYRISRAHCQLLLVSNFILAAFDKSGSLKPDIAHALQQVAILFCISTLEQESADFLACGYLSPEQVLMIKRHLVCILKSIRPNAVALVDAFGLPDYMLNSALGENDGYVYEKMTAMAELEPLNQAKVVDGYEDFIRPLIHNGKHNWRIGKDGVARL
jgi:acyl-CoA oxidase